MNSMDSNFISAVVYVHNNSDAIICFFDTLYAMLKNNYCNFEIIVVNDVCTDNSISILKEWASKNIICPMTIIHMSKYHGLEDAMNAGIDAAIGDYIFEYDYVSNSYNIEISLDAYKKVLEGNDIVCVCPRHSKLSSRLFYRIFNKYSRNVYKIRTDIFRIVTRRAINRVHASNQYMPFRKAAYAAAGLKVVSIIYDGSMVTTHSAKASLAIDSLILYTNAGFKVSLGISIFMMIVALVELIYTVVIYCMGKPIEGWTTMMLVVTFGFLGLFILISIVIRYLSINTDMSFRKQKYLIESMEKISQNR